MKTPRSRPGKLSRLLNRIDTTLTKYRVASCRTNVAFWDRVSAPGFALSAGYVALVIASFAMAKSIPADLGFEWIPFLLLTLPWSDLFERIENPDVPWTLIVAWIALLAGIVVNTAAIYVIGSLMQPMWVQFMNWHKNRDH